MANNRQNIIKKQPTGFGMFVRKDVNGRSCCIGDRVKITTPEQSHEFPISNSDPFSDEEHTEEKTFEERTISGVLCLWFSKGIVLKLDNGSYMKINMATKSPTIKRIWELI
jgi:hypothetical protein